MSQSSRFLLCMLLLLLLYNSSCICFTLIILRKILSSLKGFYCETSAGNVEFDRETKWPQFQFVYFTLRVFTTVHHHWLWGCQKGTAVLKLRVSNIQVDLDQYHTFYKITPSNISRFIKYSFTHLHTRQSVWPGSPAHRWWGSGTNQSCFHTAVSHKLTLRIRRIHRHLEETRQFQCIIYDHIVQKNWSNSSFHVVQ